MDLNDYVGKTGPVMWKVGTDGVFTASGPVPYTSAAYPAARMIVKVYDAETPNAIWLGSASGQPTTFGIATTKGIQHKTNLVPILNEGASTAWTAVFQSFQADKAKSAVASN